ncbi:MAG: lysophospholipid acyltransferase family protein [Opitutales bacterium]
MSPFLRSMGWSSTLLPLAGSSAIIMAKSTSTSLWRPGNAFAALGILLLRAAAKLPIPWMQAIGKAIGSFIWVVFPYRKRVALTNIRLCFPEMPESGRLDLARRHYQAMGMGIFELAAAWYKSPEQLQKISEVVGMEHLEAVAASGRGALLLSAHFTTLEIGGRILLTHRLFSCLYRKPDQPVIAREMTRSREKLMKRVIHMDEMNDLIRALREGDMVWYAPDQGKKIKYSEVLPFFGVPAVTNTATARIARMGKAAIVPFMGYRLPDGTYRVEIYPEVKDIPTKDPAADAVRINHLIEELILRAPEQYFWLHKRFKRRGPGYENVYARNADPK